MRYIGGFFSNKIILPFSGQHFIILKKKRYSGWVCMNVFIFFCEMKLNDVAV